MLPLLSATFLPLRSATDWIAESLGTRIASVCGRGTVGRHVDQRRAGGLREDRRRFADVAEVDRADVERLRAAAARPGTRSTCTERPAARAASPACPAPFAARSGWRLLVADAQLARALAPAPRLAQRGSDDQRHGGDHGHADARSRRRATADERRVDGNVFGADGCMAMSRRALSRAASRAAKNRWEEGEETRAPGRRPVRRYIARARRAPARSRVVARQLAALRWPACRPRRRAAARAPAAAGRRPRACSVTWPSVAYTPGRMCRAASDCSTGRSA